MARIILLDTGLIGLACRPARHAGVVPFDGWLQATAAGADLVIPDVCRFEIRRELLRLRASAQLRRLDDLCDGLGTAPITAETWDRAAEFWALVRQGGRPTAAPDALDGDAILAAVAATIGGPDDEVLVATTNVGHLGRFPGIDARRWEDIS